MQERFSQYDLTRELSKKHSHVTYLASPTSAPERQVVLTVFASSLFHSSHECDKLLQKAQYIKELRHLHLVPILDMGIEEEQPFVVRAYLPGDSLRSRLKKLSPAHLKLHVALTMVSQIGQVLVYAHKQNIVHGNIKPENIFFDANGQPILTDFNLVDWKDAIIRDQTVEEFAFCYIAPEQFTGTYDARSDQYALGCLAYELITGHVPFAAQTLGPMMGQSIQVPPAPLSSKVVDLPPSLEVAILKALSHDPDERFFDFSLFLEVIQSVLPSAPMFPFACSSNSHKNRSTSSPTPAQPAKAENSVSPIHKRTARHIAPLQLSEPQGIISSVEVTIRESGGTHSIFQVSVPEQAEVISLPVSLGTILQSFSQDTDFADNREHDNPNQSLKKQKHNVSSATVVEMLQPEISNLEPVMPILATERDVENWSITKFLVEEETDKPSLAVSASLVYKQGESEVDEMALGSLKTTNSHRSLTRRVHRSRRSVFKLVLLILVIALLTSIAGSSKLFPFGMSQNPTSIVRQATTVQSGIDIPQINFAPKAKPSVQAISTSVTRSSVQAISTSVTQSSVHAIGALAVQSSAQTPTVSGNLIVNGDAESGPGANDGSNEAGIVVSTIPSWTRTGNFNVLEYSANDGDATPSDPGPPDRGNNYFIGGPEDGTDNTTTSATQTIDVSANAGIIDTGKVTFTLSAYLGGYTDQDDNAVLTIYFQNAANQQIGEASIGPVLAADRNDQSGLLSRSTNGTLPEGTRTIQVALVMTKEDGDYNDGSADNLSLVLQY